NSRHRASRRTSRGDLMTTRYRSPGVYRQDIFERPAAALVTGVPGFVGLAGDSSPTPPNQPVVLHRKEEFAVRFTQTSASFGFWPRRLRDSSTMAVSSAMWRAPRIPMSSGAKTRY